MGMARTSDTSLSRAAAPTPPTPAELLDKQADAADLTAEHAVVSTRRWNSCCSCCGESRRRTFHGEVAVEMARWVSGRAGCSSRRRHK
jgi:hypothetical protein